MLAAGSDGQSQQEIYDVMNLGHMEGADYKITITTDFYIRF